MQHISYNYVSGIYGRACHLCYVIHYYTTTAEYDYIHVAIATTGCIYCNYLNSIYSVYIAYTLLGEHLR